MKKLYTSFGIGRRNFFAWASALCMLLSLTARIVYYSLSVEGAEGVGTTLFAFFFLIVPIIANAWFICALLVHGENRLYKTISPVYLGAVFFVARICTLYASLANDIVTSRWHVALCIIFYIAASVIYRLTVNAGGIKNRIPALLIFLLPFIYHIAIEDFPRFAEHPEISYWLAEISILLMMLSIILVVIGMRKLQSETPLPMRGDRCDGRRLRSLDPIAGVGVYIMPDRNGASNLFMDCFECSNAEKYIRQKRDEGLSSFGYTHLILAAYVRTVSQRPAVNRFISGQKIYSRDGDIEVSMAIKKEMTTDASETIITIYFSPEDTAKDVYEKFNAELEKAKGSSELDSSFDKLAGLLNLIPGVFMKFTVWLLKTMDYFGMLPRWLLRLSPFHASLFITSMGSLGIPPIYHHLYDFGNIPIFVAFGIKRRENELQADGSIVQHKYIDFSVVTDERICDGFYFASSIKQMKRFLANPEKLDVPPETIVRDVD